MRTSAGGITNPPFDRSRWIDRDSGALECPECGRIEYIISNPSPNTQGGTKPLRVHQRLCWEEA